MTNLLNYLNNNLTFKIWYNWAINEQEIIEQLKNINEINKNEYEYNENDWIWKKTIMLCNKETFTLYEIKFIKNNIKCEEYLYFKNIDKNTILFEKQLLYK